MMGLMNVDEALNRILKEIGPLPIQSLLIEDALGKVIADEIVSDINLPPFRSSSMDGFGVRVEDIQGASRDNPISLTILGTIQAGDQPLVRDVGVGAVSIMTGAPVPDWVSAVIPIEDTDADWNSSSEYVKIYRTANLNDNIRPIGEDVIKGQKIFSQGHLLRPVDIAMLASIGKRRIDVIQQPHVVVLSTGDELMEVGKPIRDGQIYESNSFLLEALIKEIGAKVTRLPIVQDTRQAVESAFEQALSLNPSMIISSGGVSMGATDYIRVVLEERGQVNFWRINLKPGKPFIFAQLADVPFFGLPGNPVSVWVTFDVLVRPALYKQAGKRDDVKLEQAILKKSVKSDGRRTYMRVKLSVENGQLYADSTGTQSSGALMSMVLADGLLIIPEGLVSAQAGDVYAVRVVRKYNEL